MPRSPLRSSSSLRRGRIVRSQDRRLLVIDNDQLRATALSELKQVRHQLAELGAEVTRHEQVDIPSYHEWVHRTFPQLLTELRTLSEEVMAKERDVREVEFLSLVTGKSAHKLWKDRHGIRARGSQSADEPWDENDVRNANSDSDFAGSREEADDFDDGEASTSDHESKSFRQRPATPPPSPEIKDVYRRLVQKLHPDRGGPWTPQREHLWHQAQEAWVERDLDRLLSLEVQWNSDAEPLSAFASIGRLRRAIQELIATRGNVDRQLRRYRESPQWKFTLTPKKRTSLARKLRVSLEEDCETLRDTLDTLNLIIARWEKSGSKRSRRRKAQDEDTF